MDKAYIALSMGFGVFGLALVGRPGVSIIPCVFIVAAWGTMGIAYYVKGV